jgi:uncharacterized LabA/DUF88 family protein
MGLRGRPERGGLSAFYPPLKTYVYVDGFNLYYGAVRGTPFKWLDLNRLLRTLLRRDNIVQIRYFTALVGGGNDPESPQRQQLYLRALRTLPNLSIHFGHFMQQVVSMRLETPIGGKRFARVVKFEEKGSDVNLATHMLVDGFDKAYEQAVIVTNDSDLLEPVKIVRQKLQLPVGMITPHKKASKALVPFVTFVKRIRVGPLAACQFDNPLTDAQGCFAKPSTW